MKLTDFKNKYQGRCFILGNGNSLNKVDFSKLKDEYTFGIHRISYLYEKKNWKPSFYISTGGKTDTSWDSLRKGIPSFLNSSYKKRFGNKIPQVSNVIYLNCDSTGYVPIPNEIDLEKLWSYNPEEKVTIMGTGLQACVQLATYMGFTEIYFIGTDLEFYGKQTHFDKRYESFWVTRKDHKKHFQNLLNAHELIKMACDSIGVKTYNATHGGILETYERVDFDSLF